MTATKQIAERVSGAPGPNLWAPGAVSTFPGYWFIVHLLYMYANQQQMIDRQLTQKTVNDAASVAFDDITHS